ncbi:MAG: hypothetical protein ACK5HS_04970 [Mycoplasmatales bacterium]
MRIDIVKLFEDGQIKQNEKIDFSTWKTSDALIKKIKDVDVDIDAIAINNDEFSINLEYVVNVIYLDANDLKELDLVFDYTDNLLFTINSEKESDEILFCENNEVLEIDQYVFELACLNLPLNYSKVKREYTPLDSENNNPFKDAFKK